MFVEGGWKPPHEPPPHEPRMTDREELVMRWFIVVFAALLLIAPIGGATIIHPILALLGIG